MYLKILSIIFIIMIAATMTGLIDCIKNNIFRKKARYSHQFSSSERVIVMKYKDNNVVNIASNYEFAEISTKKIYSAEKKGNVSLLRLYNSFMGVVNNLDQL